MQQKTIAAIATPLAVGGISIIRISGEYAIEIADKVFVSENGKKLADKKGYTSLFGAIYDKEKRLDSSVATVFRAPKSYTGEDIVELSCHGGIFITREVLRVIISAGAAHALPGEFTKRGFLNGKLSLTQAEAVVDLINSKNKQALNAAREQLDGALYKRIDKVLQELIKIAGHLSAWIDYPDEDIEGIENGEIKNSLNEAKNTLTELLLTFDRGRLIKEGIDTVIVGKPNVGKSTLMNLLAGCQKSIVTEIAGTTRDIVEETVNLFDIMLRLSDTAGIRQTEDKVEQFGVELAKKKLNSASLVLMVFDSSVELDKEDFAIIEEIKDKAAIAIINKSDLELKIDMGYISSKFDTKVFICATDEKGIDTLENAIKQKVMLYDFDMSGGMIANERQREAAILAKEYVEEAIYSLNINMTFDAVTVSIEAAINALLLLTGKKVTEEVVNEVFSHFCVGK